MNYRAVYCLWISPDFSEVMAGRAEPPRINHDLVDFTALAKLLEGVFHYGPPKTIYVPNDTIDQTTVHTRLGLVQMPQKLGVGSYRCEDFGKATLVALRSSAETVFDVRAVWNPLHYLPDRSFAPPPCGVVFVMETADFEDNMIAGASLRPAIGMEMIGKDFEVPTGNEAGKLPDELKSGLERIFGCRFEWECVVNRIAQDHAPKQIKAIESTFDLFYPRYHWTTPSVWSCSEMERSLVILLSAMIRNGIVDRITDRAKMEFIGGRYSMPPGDWSEEQRKMYGLCQSRRGNDDLKRQSWSAYLALQKRFPGDEVTILGSPCFLVYAEQQHTAIVPGNCSPRTMLEFVSERRIRSLFFINGCVDEAILQENEDYWLLDGLKFSDRAIDLFDEEFAKERDSMERLSSEISSEMPPIFDAMSANLNLDKDGQSN